MHPRVYLPFDPPFENRELFISFTGTPCALINENSNFSCNSTSYVITQLNVTGGQVYSWFPPTGLDDPASPTPAVSLDTTIKYYVKGTALNGCYGIQRWGDVQIEEFSIFNRWGVRVFTTRNPSQCWDDAFYCQPQPTGSYVYVIRAKTFCGPVIRTGSLTLVR